MKKILHVGLRPGVFSFPFCFQSLSETSGRQTGSGKIKKNEKARMLINVLHLATRVN